MFYIGRGPLRFIYNNPITENYEEVRYVLEVMMWINMCVCLPMTILIIYCVFYAVRRVKVPIISYTNLLISNLIQMCIMIAWVARVERSICVMIHASCAMASLYFKMCIALERCFFFAYPLLDCLRQTRSSVLVCVLVWAFCIVSVPLAIILKEFVRLIIYALLPAPMSIFCLAWTFTALPAATSVPTEDKRRSLGTLLLLFSLSDRSGNPLSQSHFVSKQYFPIMALMVSCHLSNTPYDCGWGRLMARIRLKTDSPRFISSPWRAWALVRAPTGNTPGRECYAPV
ncbi:uncharacterized protein LOC112842008 [Oreochromis niloticus]|uniref:uncharacterized protein LOC112842008 n=1 Tax=Oreochromis niloticus TaxID=8128 RepID=UPI000DF35A85|nr:uncharacterized protein LOC112842008 [Oreochromis niloticus]